TETEFYKSKILTTGFYFDRLLTRTRSLVSAMQSGADNLMSMPESMFAIE
ncbi:MAG: acyl-CoA dehydrogenase C-terminal domain-containing protein, partial [Pseudomonadota bacterium]|nr:acyl-CoA dehydrogenase C-terminal domain-containing protein [Pseudomonadota bacterium]